MELPLISSPVVSTLLNPVVSSQLSSWPLSNLRHSWSFLPPWNHLICGHHTLLVSLLPLWLPMDIHSGSYPSPGQVFEGPPAPSAIGPSLLSSRDPIQTHDLGVCLQDKHFQTASPAWLPSGIQTWLCSWVLDILPGKLLSTSIMAWIKLNLTFPLLPRPAFPLLFVISGKGTQWPDSSDQNLRVTLDYFFPFPFPSFNLFS